MPSYEWKGRDRDGNPQTGVLIGDNKDAVIAALRKLIPRWRGNPGRYVDDLRLGGAAQERDLDRVAGVQPGAGRVPDLRAAGQARPPAGQCGCGGVGLSAIQIAAAHGARVIGIDIDDELNLLFGAFASKRVGYFLYQTPELERYVFEVQLVGFNF